MSGSFFCARNGPPSRAIAVSTLRVTYIHNTQENSARFIRGQIITSDLNLASVIESLAAEADKKEDSVVITRKTTDHYGKVIALHSTSAGYEREAWVDPRTKLLLRLENIRSGNPGEVLKSIDEIRYNEPVPEWLLHFRCPEGAVIKPERWGDLEDSNCGINVTGLSEQEACREIVTRLFTAINTANLEQMRHLVPVTRQWTDEQLIAAVQENASRFWDNRMPGVPAYEIGAPYRDRACPLGVLVPCILTDHNGRRFEITLIVRFRERETQRTGVVVFTWGQARPLDG